MSTITEPGDIVTEVWLRRIGRILAADERARTMRTAAVRLDRLLGAGRARPEPRDTWECPGEHGADGHWQPHCGSRDDPF